jgi:hypothetical protein
MKATIYALTDNPGEVELAESWLEANRKVLSFISEQTHMVVVSWGGILKAQKKSFLLFQIIFQRAANGHRAKNT